MFVVGAMCMLVAGSLVLDTAMTNERRKRPWHEGIGRWAVMTSVGLVVEVVGFALAVTTA